MISILNTIIHYQAAAWNKLGLLHGKLSLEMLSFTFSGWKQVYFLPGGVTQSFKTVPQKFTTFKQRSVIHNVASVCLLAFNNIIGHRARKLAIFWHRRKIAVVVTKFMAEQVVFNAHIVYKRGGFESKIIEMRLRVSTIRFRQPNELLGCCKSTKRCIFKRHSTFPAVQ